MSEPNTNAANAGSTSSTSQPTGGAPYSSRAWVWVLLVLVAFGIAAAVFLHKAPAEGAHGRNSGTPPALPISTALVRKGDIGIYVNALGTVTPVYTVMLKSRVDGQLMKVNYTEGERVKEGDLLVEIDSRPFQAMLDQAEGQLARDKALLENAHVDLDRYKTALAKNAIPKQQYDTQVATVHQYEGAVKLDEGQVENARLQLTYCHITSPITGRVGLRLVDPGNIVHASDTAALAVITQLEPMTVVFSVAEDYLPQIQQQLRQDRKLTVEAYDRAQLKKLATGTLLTLDNQIDAGTGTVRLKALFPNEDDSLFPNQFVNARLLVNTDTNVTVVPVATVQRNPQSAFVYVVTNDTVAIRNVSLGPTDGTIIAVDGVEPGEIIAADSFNRLQDGAKVTVRQGGQAPEHTNATNVAVEDAKP
jgi:multidrug efflux system membrane fusion protein